MRSPVGEYPSDVKVLNLNRLSGARPSRYPLAHMQAQDLESIPFFEPLSEQSRTLIAEALEELTAAPGTLLFHYGDPGDSMYIVKEGSIELFNRDHSGKHIPLATCSSGDYFGELSLLDGGPRSAAARALTDARLLVLRRDDLLSLLHDKPTLALDMLKVMSQRIRQADDLLRSGAARNVNLELEHKLSFLNRIAYAIADFGGSMTFLLLNLSVFAIWISLNLGLVPTIIPFDPYPFGLLTMAVSLEAIFLSIIVLLAQNLQSAKDRIRGDIEYEVNLKAEMEVAHLHEKVDRMTETVLARLVSIEKATQK